MRMMTIAALAALLATPASAFTYFLARDLGVSGFERNCRYSNGQIYSVNSTSLCPMTIEDSAPGLGRGTGFSRGEYQDGLTKVCVYEVLGEDKAIRVNSYELCPLTYQF